MKATSRIHAVTFLALASAAPAQTSNEPLGFTDLVALARRASPSEDGDPSERSALALRNALAHGVLDEESLSRIDRSTVLAIDLAVLETLFEAAAVRPRTELHPLASLVLAEVALTDLHALALAVGDPSTFGREGVWTIVDALEWAEQEADLSRVLALRRSLERVPRSLADRVVGEALRRLASGTPFSDLVVVLERTTERGRARLASGVDQLWGDSESEIVRWLGSEDPAILDTWAERVFRSGRTLRLALGHLSQSTLEEFQAQLVGIIEDDSLDRSLRETAVRSMVAAGVTSTELATAVCGSNLVSERLISELATTDWPDPQPFVDAGPRMAPVLPRCPGGFEALEQLDRETDSTRPLAVLLREAPAEFALRAWDRADPQERLQYHAVLARRSDGLGVERLDDLRALGAKALASRLRLGDVDVLDEWLALEERWSLRTIRSFAELAAPLLEPRHVEGFVEVLRDETMPGRDREVVCELARRRPDLPFDEALRSMLESTSSQSLRDEIERALYERPVERQVAAEGELRIPIDRVSVPLLDAMTGALSPAEARLCARVLLEGGAEEISVRLVLKRLEGRSDGPNQGLVDALVERLTADSGDGQGRREPPFDERVLLALSANPRLRSEVAPLYARRALSAEEAGSVARVLSRFVLAEEAEAAAEFDLAAELYRDALLELEAVSNWTDSRFDLCRTEPSDPWRRSDSAYRAAKPSICRIRAALQRSDREGARTALPIARSLAYGDAVAEAAVLALEQSIR